MSGLADDWESEAIMIRQGHQELSRLQPGNPLLAHYDPAGDSLNFTTVIEALGIGKEYDTHPHRNLFAMSKYNIRLRAEIASLPRTKVT